MSKLLELLTTAAVKSSSTHGRTVSIHFGTNDIRDLSDGEFPVEVWRCNLLRDGRVDVPETVTVTAPSRFKREVNRAAKGSYAGAAKQWVEIRTPKDRTDRAALNTITPTEKPSDMTVSGVEAMMRATHHKVCDVEIVDEVAPGMEPAPQDVQDLLDEGATP